MAEIIRKDESVLTEKEKGVLDRTLEKLEQFFPEHKVFAFDAICAQQRENSAKLSKKLGYESVDDFLNAYGFEPIKGTAVYEVRKNCGIKPGEEPELIKVRIDNAIASLNEYYPDHVIEGAIQKEHKNLAQTLAGFWQWLGYKSMEDMLAAYGFTYNAKAGRKKSVDPEAIIAELKKRYPEGTDMKTSEIKDANPDLKIKSLMNSSKELFGMTFADYLVEQGILHLNQKRRSKEEIETDTKASYEDTMKEYDTLIQEGLLGWKPLPMDKDALLKSFGRAIPKKRYNNAIKDLAIDEDKHFADLGVLADDDTDNELRELIHYVDFTAMAITADNGKESLEQLSEQKNSSIKIKPSVVEKTTKYDNYLTEVLTGCSEKSKELDEMGNCLKELCERYNGKQAPKDLKTIKEDNPDLPVSKLNGLTVKVYGAKLAKYITDYVEVKGD